VSEKKGEYSAGDEVIRFTAEVARVQTLADGGLRVILDLPATAVKSIQDLIAVRQLGAVLEIAAVPLIYNKEQSKNAIPERKKRKSKWTTAEGSSTN